MMSRARLRGWGQTTLEVESIRSADRLHGIGGTEKEVRTPQEGAGHATRRTELLQLCEKT